MANKMRVQIADRNREIFEKLYTDFGPTKVYEYANKLKLEYHGCIPCDAETPTVSDKNSHTCAVCGTWKINV